MPLFVYATPTFGSATPSAAAYGDTVSVELLTLDPWNPLLLNLTLNDIRFRFVTNAVGSSNVIDVASDVPATVSSTGTELPLVLEFQVPSLTALIAYLEMDQ